ncbi:MAG: hypothetical protein AB1611_08545 [bacterium]
MAAVICGLEALDAPAYVHCRDIGVCEFLEIPVIVDDFAESPQITAWNERSGIISSQLLDLLIDGISRTLPGLSACLYARNKRDYLDFRYHFSGHYREQRQKAVHFWDTYRLNTATLHSRYAFDSQGYILTPTLQIIAASVIQS